MSSAPPHVNPTLVGQGVKLGAEGLALPEAE
jgi:hypothetical protein